MPKIKGAVVRRSWPSVTIARKNGKPAYRVDGRPHAGRRFFSDKAEALAFADELGKLKADGGSLALAMPPELRQDALEAMETLAPWNRSLAEAAKHYAAFLKTEQRKADAITVEAAADDYLAFKRTEAKRGEISPLTISELESKMRIVKNHFTGLRLIDIDQAAIQTFIDGLPQQPRGRANIRMKLSQLLNHSRRRGWIIANVAQMTSVRVPARDVTILLLPEVIKLLRTSEDHPALLPYLCLGLFAGLRPGESQQLRWTDIHFDTEQIEVRPETTKTRQRRFVPIDPLLAEWLLPYRRQTGKLVGPNFTKNWRELRNTAGLAKLSEQRSWQDILRHTHATYWLAMHGDRPRLAENLGNSVEVVRTFYRQAVPQASAAKYWRVRPTTTPQDNVIAFAMEN